MLNFSIMLTLLWGVVSSMAAEVVTALNKRLQGTVLQGDAAFLVALGMAVVGGTFKEVMAPGFQWSDLMNIAKLATDWSEVFAVSQVYFLLVVEKLNLDVQSSELGMVVPPAPAQQTAPMVPAVPVAPAITATSVEVA